MVTVMDDYSRFILAWKLQLDMTSDSLIQVVQLAIDVYWYDRSALGGPDQTAE